MGAYEDRVNAGHKWIQELGKTASTAEVTYRQRNPSTKVAKEITSIKLSNRSGSASISVSLDGGSSYYVVLPLQLYETLIDSQFDIRVKTTTSTADYDLFYTVQQ